MRKQLHYFASEVGWISSLRTIASAEQSERLFRTGFERSTCVASAEVTSYNGNENSPFAILADLWYNKTKKGGVKMAEDLELTSHHKRYSIYSQRDKWTNFYSDGPIESLQMISGKITVRYRSGETYEWETKYIDSYNMGQFGIAVSFDGTMVFAQTWENGLFCFDAKTGKRIWRTKSRRGVTNIFVSDSTVTAQLHDHAMQLIDIRTGEILKEKRPCTAWGFKSLDNKHIICQVTARKWEIIEPETLEAKESFTHKEFTGDHTEFCVNHISLCENGIIRVACFQNEWNNSARSHIKFEHFVKSKIFGEITHSNDL